MTQPNPNDPKSDSEILAGLVLGDLNDEERFRCAEALGGDGRRELMELERAAAALHLALDVDEREPMPSALKDAIVAQGMNIVRSSGSVLPRKTQGKTQGRDPSETLPTGWTLRETIAWLACAASIALALWAWSGSRTSTIGANRPAAMRELLIAQAPDLIRASWSNGKTPWETTVGGDVVWSNERQQGFLRFIDMPVNDPTQEQYQLWIIDPSRDEEPIDGGVFDITESRESIVAIDAKLQVLQPKAFAVTIEKPGGVVVSTQERLPLLALVGQVAP
jgi:anti-sigma-K factor RskA